MKSYSTKSVFTLFFVLFALLLQAQNSGEGTFYHPKQGYYTFGINGGWAYQSSDIRTSFDGFGVGLNFGKNLYYRPGAPLSFDVRGRLLYAKMLGFDGEKSFDIAENEALNGEREGGPDYTNYPVTIDNGFVYQNHRTDLGELSLEGVFRLNKLRERTGVLVGLYGGVGLDYYLTRTDQINSDTDAAYYEDYLSISNDLSKGETVNRLKDGVLDGYFETNADGFADGGRIDWMPSLGIELGYQLSPNFAIMAGHRTTFARSNLLDGHQWGDTKNDIYHYTSLGLEWNLNAKSSQPKKPEIDVRVPTYSPHTQSSRYANVRATIRHINSSADVEYFVNNKPVVFDYANGNFAANFNLKPGRNEIVLRATNSVGQAQKLLVINWEEGNVISTPDVPTNNPPTTGNSPNIRFTNPSRDNMETENSSYRVRASISGVDNQNDVSFTLNGSSHRFSYNVSRDEFSADVNLREGRNTFIIRASNSYGTDEERRTINLRKRGQAPDVRIDSPANNSTVSQSRVNLTATVLHIVNGNDIRVTVNGQNVTNINLVSNRFTKQINLREGNNTIIVRAQNQYGSDEDRINLRYTKPVIGTTQEQPIVTINSPTNNSTVTKKTAALRAKVKNVRSKNDVNLTVNGRDISNFSFNSLSGLLTTNVNLTEGNNTITVKGKNDAGQDSKTVNVRYKVENTGNAPKVSINQPSQNPYTSSTKTTTVKAKILHVPNKNGILIELNGRRVSQFGYTTSGQLNVQVSLQEGNNTVRIKATNAKGSDEKTVNIRYNRAKNPPVVNITKPANNAKVTNAKVNLIATVKNATKSQISVLLDGKSVPNFSLVATKLTALLTVRPGTHKVTVKATNKDGKAEDIAQFTYNAPAAKPTVRITQPAKDGAIVNSPKARLRATTTNVSNKSQISVLLNGRAIAFTYDLRTKLVAAALTLKSGTNTVQVQVSNAGGEAISERRVTYRPSNDTPSGKLRPKITISSISAPATNPFEPDKSRSTIIATIDNISKKSDIVFTYKGQVRNDFTYNVNEKRFQITVDLVRGDNPFEIKATNRVGTDTETRVITF